MQVIRARSAGFCLGVSLALKRLDQELAAMGGAVGGGRLITYGPIIHNPLVMRYYEDQGVVCEDRPEGVRAGDRVVIRAHGIPRGEEEALRATGAVLVDATCPKVKKAQLAIAKWQNKGGILLLFGEREHPEVRGLLSYADSRALVFGDPAELEHLELDVEAPYFLAAQTTQGRTLFRQARELLNERLCREVRALDTICDATRNRQQEVADLCARVEAMVVVGGLNSGNTRRLAEEARSCGVPAMHVEQVSDITPQLAAEVLGRAGVVGLTAGASTPEEHIDSMQAYLESLPCGCKG